MILSVGNKQDVAVAGNPLWGVEPSVLQTAIAETLLLPPYDGLQTETRATYAAAAE